MHLLGKFPGNKTYPLASILTVAIFLVSGVMGGVTAFSGQEKAKPCASVAAKAHVAPQPSGGAKPVLPADVGSTVALVHLTSFHRSAFPDASPLLGSSLDAATPPRAPPA